MAVHYSRNAWWNKKAHLNKTSKQRVIEKWASVHISSLRAYLQWLNCFQVGPISHRWLQFQQCLRLLNKPLVHDLWGTFEIQTIANAVYNKCLCGRNANKRCKSCVSLWWNTKGASRETEQILIPTPEESRWWRDDKEMALRKRKKMVSRWDTDLFI